MQLRIIGPLIEILLINIIREDQNLLILVVAILLLNLKYYLSNITFDVMFVMSIHEKNTKIDNIHGFGSLLQAILPTELRLSLIVILPAILTVVLLTISVANFSRYQFYLIQYLGLSLHFGLCLLHTPLQLISRFIAITKKVTERY